MFNKILVPLDGSDLAERALQPALAIAQQTNAEVVLLQALITDDVLIPDYMAAPMVRPEYWIEQREENALNYLSDVRTKNEHPNVQIYGAAHEGDPAGVILDTAHDGGFDLIVMSTHGYAGIKRWMLGSVTENVLRHAECPVLVIRTDEPMENIVIAVDGSARSETVLAPAMAMARLLGISVTLLRVQEEISLKGMEQIRQISSLDPGMGERIRDSFFHRADDYLDNLRHRYADVNIKLATVRRDGDPSQRILEVARALDNSVIAMATHGRTGLQRWVYGSITEKVLRDAQRNMLVVRPPHEMFDD